LEKAKKVSNTQISHTKSASSAFSSAVSTMRLARQRDASFSATTLNSPGSPRRGHAGKVALRDVFFDGGHGYLGSNDTDAVAKQKKGDYAMWLRVLLCVDVS
jgi:hypothetical protein